MTSNKACHSCLVIRSGFEPETHSLEGCCSIQLSYQTDHKRAEIGEISRISAAKVLNICETNKFWPTKFTYSPGTWCRRP